MCPLNRAPLAPLTLPPPCQADVLVRHPTPIYLSACMHAGAFWASGVTSSIRVKGSPAWWDNFQSTIIAVPDGAASTPAPSPAPPAPKPYDLGAEVGPGSAPDITKPGRSLLPHPDLYQDLDVIDPSVADPLTWIC